MYQSSCGLTNEAFCFWLIFLLFYWFLKFNKVLFVLKFHFFLYAVYLGYCVSLVTSGASGKIKIRHLYTYEYYVIAMPVCHPPQKSYIMELSKVLHENCDDRP